MNVDNTLPPDDAALAAEYAMGLLQGAERMGFERRLLTNPTLLGEVRAWQEHLVKMTGEISARPPMGAKRRLERRLFGTTRRELRVWRGLGVGGLALATVLAVALFFQPEVAPTSYHSAEIAAADNSLRVLALYDGTALRMARTHGQAANDRSLEVWLIDANGVPHSLGVLPETDTATHQVPEALRPHMAGATLAISDEPAGGSTTGQPTGAVLATGMVTSL